MAWIFFLMNDNPDLLNISGGIYLFALIELFTTICKYDGSQDIFRSGKWDFVNKIMNMYVKYR